MKRIITAFLIIVILTAFSGREEFFIPSGWPKPNYSFSKNAFHPEKLLLGRALFYDPILSRNNMISCASCHSQYNSFAHADHNLSHGIDDRIGTRNAPVLLNLAWNKSFMWDGAVHNLDMQSLAPITHPDEMDETIENVVIKLQSGKLYPDQFKKAFGDTIVTGERVLKSISTFMASLVSCNSKYDSVLRKQTQFTQQELNGYNLFRKNCSICHAEPLFTNGDFENNGLQSDPFLNDIGRMKVTGKSSDSLKFKIPTLRNIEYSFPYMHDGRFGSMYQVLDHYTFGIQNSPTISEKINGKIILTENEKVDLIAFLLTLSDRKFLFEPDYSYPKTFFQK